VTDITYADIETTRALLGYNPQTGIYDSLKRMYLVQQTGSYMKKHNYIIIFLLFVSHSIFSNGSDVKISTDDIPIIFIHLGYADYLAHSLWQALQYNKNVILISDNENNKHGLDVQYFDIAQFKAEADKFAKEYVHMCIRKNHTVPMMLSHIQRWFVLKEFMEHYDIPMCFQCDSDVMIYSNIADEIKKFEPCDLALVTGKALKTFSGYMYPIKFSDSTVIIKKELLQDYCKFIHWFYTDKDNIGKFIELYQQKKIMRFVGGMFLISRYMDMTNTQEKFIIKNICKIIDDVAFDSSTNSSFCKQFDINKQNTHRGIRIIEWIDNQPHCYNKTLDKMVRFNTLHFAASAKPLMSNNRRENIHPN